MIGQADDNSDTTSTVTYSDTPSESSSQSKFPVVAIGASAGGLSAIKKLLGHIPTDSNLAFVVVVHLSPDHKSHLAELLQPHCKIPVQQVTQTVALEPNRVYVIPPNSNLDSIDTHLRLSDLERERRERAPIDHFFRTLAKTHDGDSIGIILTGTGSDGTLGIAEIKEKGGLTIVQDPNDAEFDGMPQSAIASGLIDVVLPLDKIAETVFRYTNTHPKLPFVNDPDDLNGESHRQVYKLLSLLKARTSRDFTRYKPSTILRRIQRRMQLRQIEELNVYLDLLRESGEEVRQLADDLLINVTNFFRDGEVFEYLEKHVISQLFDQKTDQDEIRLWSVGCATGEEAYSIAMLLMEESDRRGYLPRIQIFASDLHEKSLQKARDGFYPGDIETDVTAARLKRFFLKENAGYRIRKEIREMVVFAPHNLLSDPPFSRLDFISCRNVLIYIQRDSQQDIIDLFHYALRPNGYLVLGTSESIESADLFRHEDKKCCVYRKRNFPAPEPRLPVFPPIRSTSTSDLIGKTTSVSPLPFGLLHQQIVEHYAPPSILINQNDKIVHSSEHAGKYLVHPGGEPTTNVFKLVREELMIDLRAAISSTRETGNSFRSRLIDVHLNGQVAPVVLHIRPAPLADHDGFILIIFDEKRYGDELSESNSLAPVPQIDSSHNEQELHLTRQRLQAIIEEYETSQEEMKAANEELQSTNEELRSTMEELETSKEELQSMNEELQTVNQENRHKVEELAQLSSDLQNLLAATDIATLFLDREGRILRFTPKVAELFNIRLTDRGRPLSDLTHSLGYNELHDDAYRVLEKLIPIEKEVQDRSNRLYLTRILPYRSPSDRIEGTVITFVDITARKIAEEALGRSEAFQQLAVDAAKVGIWELNFATQECQISRCLASIMDCQSKHPAGQAPNSLSIPKAIWLQAVHPDDREAMESAFETCRRERSPFQLEFRTVVSDGSVRWIFSTGAISEVPQGEPTKLLGACIDVTHRKRNEELLRESEAKLEAELEAMGRLHAMVARLLLSPDLDTALHELLEAAIDITTADRGMVQLLDPVTESLTIVSHHGFAQKVQSELDKYCPKNDGSELSQTLIKGRRVVIDDVRDNPLFAPYQKFAQLAGFRAVQIIPLVGRNNQLFGLLSTCHNQVFTPADHELVLLDLYARQAADFIEHVRATQLSKEADKRKDEFIATLAHELRNPLAPIHLGLELLHLSEDKTAVFTEISPMINRQLHQLTAIVDDLLDVSRITRGKLELRKERTLLRNVLESAIEATQAYFLESKHILMVDFLDVDLEVLADPHRLAQICTNLLSNAAKYTPEGGKVKVAVTALDDQVSIAVTDNGIGIPAHMRERIFEMFTQINRVEGTVTSGLGIGLSLVKSLVELHDGMISIESAGAGQGTTVTVSIPRYRHLTSSSADSNHDHPQTQTSAANGHNSKEIQGSEEIASVEKQKYSILVVDDNQSAARTLSMLLKLSGHDVHIAFDGQQAIESAESLRPQFIFMDLGMPVMDGLQAARAIRSRPWSKDTKLIALSGWGTEADKAKSLAAGFDSHLTKPASSDHVNQILEKGTV